MTESVDNLIRALRGARDVNAHYRAIDAFVKNGEFETVVALARAMEDRPDLGAEPWGLEAVFDYSVRALALRCTTDSAAAAIQLGLSVRTRSVQRPRAKSGVARKLAELLVSGQTKSTMLAILARSQHQPALEETLACWIQELVVRDHDLTDNAVVERFWSHLRRTEHPLATLPLRLEAPETDLRNWLPQVHVRGSGRANPYGPSYRTKPEVIEKAVEVLATEVAIGPDVAKVFANWEQESNGRIEAKAFRFDRQVQPSAVTAAFLKTLPLDCLRGAALEEVVVRAVAPAQALAILFAAAAGGGAYDGGRGGAYGRLDLWQSTAALIGEGAANIASLARQAQDWNWYSFDAAGDWFDQVAWDLGIVALSPDTRQMSVLAATDTD